MPDPRATIIVLAKAPVAGRVKTRLQTEFSPAEAAALASAALLDTLVAARGVDGASLVLALDGASFAAGARHVDAVVAQRGGGLAERIDAAFSDCHAPGLPTLLIGMDTPQVTAPLLAAALDLLAGAGAGAGAGAPAVLGHAADGGWWALGLEHPRAELLSGVPMSTAETGSETEKRLRESGFPPVLLPELRDVDTPDDARAVAALAPGTGFARLLAALRPARDAAA